MKFLKIDGIIEIPDELNTDEFINAYIDLIEKHNCYFGGGFNDVTECEQAHKSSSKNREKLIQDKKCGCFYCLNIFSPTEIKNWLGKETAVCPHCGIDAVIGEGSGYPITKQFLEKMKQYWF